MPETQGGSDMILLTAITYTSHHSASACMHVFRPQSLSTYEVVIDVETNNKKIASSKGICDFQ